MLDLVKPCLENQLVDRQTVKELQLHHNKLSKRLQYMEACFNQQKGRNKVFDQINERVTVAEMWQRQNQTTNEGKMLRLKEQHEDVMKEIRHIHVEIENQVNDIKRLRDE